MITNKNIDKVIQKIEKNVKTLPYVKEISQKDKDPFKILVSTVLSSRTKDDVTKRASEKLFSVVKKPSDILKMNEKEIERLIYPVGFYRNKAKILKEMAKVLIEKFNGRVPDKIDDLLKLPGVGRKTANLVLILAFNKKGICVDTHVHKIVNRWGYVKTKTPEETEIELRKKLPVKYWRKINHILVEFGKQTCRPISPLCSKCPIKNICPKIGVKRSR